jgi:hypothetical protein
LTEPAPSTPLAGPYGPAELPAVVALLEATLREHAHALDQLTAGSTPLPEIPEQHSTSAAGGAIQGSAPVFILAMDGADYDRELAELTTWVNDLLIPEYTREISTTRPWCDQWHEHPEAVARLHALWLAFQQHMDVEASGLSGMATWHRDHLDHVMGQLRAPDGPFAACTTNPGRRSHRLLSTAAPPQTDLPRL